MPYTYTDENGVYTIHAFVDTPPTARRGREQAFAPEPEELKEHLAQHIGVGAEKGKLSKSILRELGKLPKTKTKRLVIVADIPENDALKKENEELKKKIMEMDAEMRANDEEFNALNAFKNKILEKNKILTEQANNHAEVCESEWNLNERVIEMNEEMEKLKKKNKELHTQLTIRDKIIAERNTDVSFFPYDERDVKEMIGEQYDQDGNCDWEFTCEDGGSADDWFNEFKEYACEEMNGSYGEMSWKEACENMIDNFVCGDGKGGVMWNN